MVRSNNYIATPPGATIKEQLIDRGMSQKEFALRMNMSEKHISKLINGEVQLTPETALKLEMVLGVPAQFWSNLESIYREKLVKIAAESGMGEDSEIAKRIPYDDMMRKGWVMETRNPSERVYYLRKYFEVVELSLLGNDQIAKAAGKSLRLSDKRDLAFMAWIQEAKIKARGIQTAPINIKKLVVAIPEIRSRANTLQPDDCSQVKESLATFGIALVFLPPLKGVDVGHITFFDGNKIVMTLVNDGSNQESVMFNFFHELAHIVLGHVYNTAGISDVDEKDALKWAQDMLVLGKGN